MYYCPVDGLPAGPMAAYEEGKNKEADITAPKHWVQAGDVNRELATSPAQRPDVRRKHTKTTHSSTKSRRVMCHDMIHFKIMHSVKPKHIDRFH